MKKTLSLLIFIFFHFAVMQAQSVEEQTREIHRLINKHRTGMGLKPFVYSDFIETVAIKHSKNMAMGKVKFGHDGFDKRGKIILEKLQSSGVAENVAYGDVGAAKIVEGWLNSPGHRKNIEGDYSECGIGIVKNKKGLYYYTHIFSKK